jgi:hypothetical protein
MQQLPTINGDERQLRQLFHNLISNALKYNKPGEAPVVTIHCTIADGSGEHKKYFQVEVSDNGIGFNPEYTEKIFQVFYRLHGRSEYPGTGVGLSIAKKVVENHGGQIHAESIPGEGAKFKILFPAE